MSFSTVAKRPSYVDRRRVNPARLSSFFNRDENSFFAVDVSSVHTKDVFDHRIYGGVTNIMTFRGCYDDLHRFRFPPSCLCLL